LGEERDLIDLGVSMKKNTDPILLCTLQDRRDKGVEAKEKRKTVGGKGILVLTSEWSLINEP
jgi:hypothetical protein